MLDPRPSDVELLTKAAARGAIVNGVRLGPDSPLLKRARTKAQREADRLATRAAHADDPIDPSGRMNKTERRRAEVLEAKRQAGHIRAWYFEGIALNLGYRTFYHPDFLVVERTGVLTIEEVKGHWRDDARVKIKVAARLYPCFNFVALKKLKKKQGSGWDIEAIKP